MDAPSWDGKQVSPWASAKSLEGKTLPMLDVVLNARKQAEREARKERPKPRRPLGAAYFRTLPDTQLLGIIESDGWTISQRIEAANVFVQRPEPYTGPEPAGA